MKKEKINKHVYTDEDIIKLLRNIDAGKTDESIIEDKAEQEEPLGIHENSLSPVPPAPSLKWYEKKRKKALKQHLILKHVKEFSQPKNIGLDKNKRPIVYQEDEKTIKEYTKELQKLTIKELKTIGHVNEFKEYKFKIGEVFKKLNKKKRCIVRIIHKNNTIYDYIISQNTRFFTISDQCYLRVIERGIYDSKYGMICYIYYEGNPFPIRFVNDYSPLDCNGNTVPDTQILKKTMKFEYAEQLATSNLDKNINLAMVFSILSFCAGTACIILLVIIMNSLKVI